MFCGSGRANFAQIKPLKRGGGRRYYRPEDVDLLRGVRALLYKDGYTIKGVQKVFRDQGVRFVMETGRAANDDSVAGIARTVVERGGEDVSDSGDDDHGLDRTAKSILKGIARRLEALKADLDADAESEEPGN